jgi:hypothetical protein
MFEFWFAVLIMSAVIVITGVMFARSKPHLSKPHRSKSATTIDDSVASARVVDNVRLYQQRLSELDQLLAVSDIDAQAHSSLVLEARSQLIVDLNNPSSLKPDDDIEQWIQQLIQELEQQAIPQADEARVESHSGRGILWAAGLSIPLLALAIYLPQGLSIGGSLEWQVAEQLGTLNSTTDARQRQQQLLTVTQLLEQRASLSRSKPELLQLQAEIYSAMNQHRDAANVYSALLERNTENAAVTALLAQSLYLLDAETASANTSAAALMSQRVRELLSSALRLDPQQ